MCVFVRIIINQLKLILIHVLVTTDNKYVGAIIKNTCTLVNVVTVLQNNYYRPQREREREREREGEREREREREKEIIMGDGMEKN